MGVNKIICYRGNRLWKKQLRNRDLVAIFSQSSFSKHFSSSHSDATCNHGKERKSPPWRILFFGTDHFSLKSLQVLTDNRNHGHPKLVETVDVVTKHKCPVREFAEGVGLEVFDWPIPVSMPTYDLGVLVSFGKLIPKRVIKMFPYGIINIHPSLLPRWRGSAPIPHTILNGDTQTGVSIMHIQPAHFDVGPILVQEKYFVPHNCTSLQLASDLAEKGSKLMLEVLADLPNYIAKSQPQNTEGITLAHKLCPSMGNINWGRQTCQQIDQQYRAFHELFPLKSSWYGHPVKFGELVRADDTVKEYAEKHFSSKFFLPGQPFYTKSDGVLYVHCKDGWVGFRKIVLRRPMTAKDFHSGYLSKIFSKSVTFSSLENGLFCDYDS